MNVSELEGGLGGALGVDGGWLPPPTRPQRYCDPASLFSSDWNEGDGAPPRAFLSPLNKSAGESYFANDALLYANGLFVPHLSYVDPLQVRIERCVKS